MICRDINYYLDRAKKRSGIQTDKDLNRLLGYRSSMIAHMRSGRSFPTEDMMLLLADLSGVHEHVALLDLAACRNSGRVRQAYISLLDQIAPKLPPE